MVWGLKHMKNIGEKVYTHRGSAVCLLSCSNALGVGNGDNEGR